MRPIYFIEKSTLLDYPGKIASIIFNWGCNFRCPFCHNPELVVESPSSMLINKDGVISFLKKRVGKIDAVVFTGGEPFVNPETIDFVKEVKDLGFLVKMDTNGSFPDKLQYLIDNRLVDYIAMDIKNDLTTYLRTIGLEKQHEESVKQLGDIDIQNDNSVKQSPLSLLERVKESISIIMATSEANYPIDYEFRTTFVPGLHSIDSAKGIGELIRGAKIFYVQNFRPGKTLDPLYLKKNGFTDSDLKSFADTISKYVDEVVIR